MKQPIETLTQRNPSPPPAGTSALVSLTPLARVVFLQQRGAEVAHVLVEEAGVLHPRLRWWVQAVGPVAVIQILGIHKPNMLINRFVLFFFRDTSSYKGESEIQVHRQNKGMEKTECDVKIASECVWVSYQTANHMPWRVCVSWRLTTRSQNGRHIRNPWRDWVRDERRKKKIKGFLIPEISHLLKFLFELTSLSVERSGCVPQPGAGWCHCRENRAATARGWD